MIDCGSQESEHWVLPHKPDKELIGLLRRRRRINSAIEKGQSYIPKFVKPHSKWYIQRLSSQFDEFSWREIKELGIKFKE